MEGQINLQFGNSLNASLASSSFVIFLLWLIKIKRTEFTINPNKIEHQLHGL